MATSRNFWLRAALAATVLVTLTCIVAGGDGAGETVQATEAPAKVADAANATNATQSKPLPKNMDELKAALTEAAEELEPGLALAYFMLVLFASVPIYFGSFASITSNEEGSDQEVEIMTSADAMQFPLYASCALFSMFLLFKYVGPEYVNLVLGAYFFMLGTASLTSALRPVGTLILPEQYVGEPYHFALTQKAAKDDEKEAKEAKEGEDAPADILHFELTFDNIDLTCLAMSSLVGVWYLCTKHWIATNLYGLSFALNGITLFVLPSFNVGALLLSGLFFYDIFWVFCTPVMVTVARSFDAPIKVIFPKDFMENGFAAKQHAMLGLGDIVLPGVLIALLCRFDFNSGRTWYPYFHATYIAYILGLLLTIVIMHTFKAAQPALLYLVPACLSAPLLVALVRGELKELFAYSEEPEEPAEGEAKDAEAKKDE